MPSVRRSLRAYAAEALGTFALIFAGTGSIVVDSISGGQISALGVGLVFGLTVGVVVCAIGHVSGAHINPAVSVAFTLARHLPGRRLPGYLTSQLAGALAASALVRLLFGNVAHLGATVPSGSPYQSLGIEVVLTAFLMFVVMAVATDARVNSVLAPYAVGGTVATASILAGPVSGGSLNPARSLAPALWSGTWDHQWVYLLGPVTGAVLGAVLYQLVRAEAPSAELKAGEGGT